MTTTILDLAAPHLIDNAYLLNAYFLTMNPPSPPDAPSSWQQWNLPDFRTSGNEKWAIGYVTLHSPLLYLRIGHAAVLPAGRDRRRRGLAISVPEQAEVRLGAGASLTGCQAHFTPPTFLFPPAGRTHIFLKLAQVPVEIPV